MHNNSWARLLAYVTGLVNQRLILQCEYLVAENRILRSHLPANLRLLDSERRALAEIGKRPRAEAPLRGRWCRQARYHPRLVPSPDCPKFDGSKHRSYPGRPRVTPEVEALIVRMAKENGSWGYDRIAGALANLGHHVSDQTVGNVLRRHGIPTAPKRSQTTTWKDFISAHMSVLAGTDFFSVEVLTWRGLTTYYVLFFLNLETRRITLAGMTRHPTQSWIIQMARNAVDDTSGALRQCRYLLHDRDAKFCAAFDDVLASEGIRSLKLPAHSPNLNAFAERWVRSVKQECLSRLILFGERSLQRALSEFIAHYHSERNHQGKQNVLLFPAPAPARHRPTIRCRERLGGLLRYYCRAA